MYNDVLYLLVAEVDQADNIALVVVAKHPEDAEMYLCEAIGDVKTKAVFIRVENHIITCKPF